MRLWPIHLTLLLVACGQPAAEPAAEAPPAAAIEILDARVHLLPGGMGAVYFAVRDAGGGDRLVAVETAAARAAETHETVMDGDAMRMVPRPEGFEVPAGGTLELAPGGKHVMLVDAEVAEAAETVRLTLRFERAGAVDVDAPLVPLDGTEHGGTRHDGRGPRGGD
ncbi:MAG TPA: copper chaperone PCu(A)C [Thermoanaerobaculia bacterium]|jgi:copper(I)-binding protein